METCLGDSPPTLSLFPSSSSRYFLLWELCIVSSSICNLPAVIRVSLRPFYLGRLPFHWPCEFSAHFVEFSVPLSGEFGTLFPYRCWDGYLEQICICTFVFSFFFMLNRFCSCSVLLVSPPWQSLRAGVSMHKVAPWHSVGASIVSNQSSIYFCQTPQPPTPP